MVVCKNVDDIEHYIREYIKDKRTLLTYEQLKKVLTYYVDGKPLGVLTREYGKSRSSLYSTIRYFEKKYNVMFTRHRKDKPTKKFVTKGTVKTEADVLNFIVKNSSVEGKILIDKIQVDFGIRKKKARKLYRKNVDIFCTTETNLVVSNEIIKFVEHKKISELEILAVIQGLEEGKARKVIAEETGINYKTLNRLIVDMKNTGILKKA